MNEQTLKALQASIAHHEAQLLAEKPEDVKLSSAHCALCNLFNSLDTPPENECGGCPVAGPNKMRMYCSGTPFDTAYLAKKQWHRGSGTRETFLSAQQAQIDFLKSLLPTGEA